MRLNRQTPFSQREHHFYVAIAKYLFRHAEHGIVPVGEPLRLKEAERYGLRPLILYGLTVAGLPIRWMTFAPLDQPRAVRDVLPEAWRKAAGLRGRPDILRIGRHLAAARTGGGYVENRCACRSGGFQGEVSSRFAALGSGLLPMAAEAAHSKRLVSSGSDRGSLPGRPKEHDFDVRDDRRGAHSCEVNDRIRQWLALPVYGSAPAAGVNAS